MQRLVKNYNPYLKRNTELAQAVNIMMAQLKSIQLFSISCRSIF